MASSDAAFANFGETLRQLQFHATQWLKRGIHVADNAILGSRLRPSLIVVFTILITLTFLALLSLLRTLVSIRLKETLFSWIRSLPVTQRLIQKEKTKLKEHLEKQKRQFMQDEKSITSLPLEGWSNKTVLQHLTERNKRNTTVSQSESQVSGVVYLAGKDLDELQCEVYLMHSLTNALHPDIFPSVRQMEAEVVSMCADLMNPSGSAKHVCGAMTGGGSESILLAVKACRDFMQERKGITEPEMIIAQSAHAAYYKAAEYFNIKLVTLKVNRNYQMPLKELRRKVGFNTILIVASAPGYPHGIIDPIEQISAIARNNGVLLHVDCCLGGFFLPFAKELEQEVPQFDFSLKGVTSISIDTHKYGMAHKGTSVVLYRSPALRKYQYTAVSDWTGGMYISPGVAGSRPGALIATAWASMMRLGRKGYLKATEDILKAISDFKDKLRYIPDLEIVGNPIGSIVAIKLKDNLDRIYQLNDLMAEKGWHLSPLQFPPALHITFTVRHVDVIDRLVQDLRKCMVTVKETPNGSKSGTAAIYGTACKVPDRRIVKDLLDTYQDTLLSP